MAKSDLEKNQTIVDEEEIKVSTRPQQSLPRRLLATLARELRGTGVSRKRTLYTRAFVALAILTILLGLAYLIWMSLVLGLIHRLKPHMPRNGLRTIIHKWKEPTSATSMQVSWMPNFSTGVTPKPIHSHNDYSRDIPLFRALSVGCTGVEADIWLEKGDLWVGHTQRDIKSTRTLQSLYLNPLFNIISSQNKQNPDVNGSAPLMGVFNKKPKEQLILLLDFKSDPEGSFPLVVSQLAPFRDAGYLTRWDGTKLVQGPLAIVASGLASKRLDLLPSSNGTIFLDAPLEELSQPNSPYNNSNSLYASNPLSKAIHGRVPFGGLTSTQTQNVAAMAKVARDRGLKARFWATPGWPIGLRDHVWKELVRADVGMLNVDDVKVAAMWNWDRCVVAGIRLC